jgi:GTP pyrophosphokinase
MPSPSNLPLSFNRDRAVRQLDARLEELLEKLRKNRPSEDPWMVRRAYEIATERHHDQFRSSGEPYVSHLLEVAHILGDMRLDATTLTAAILHDAIEDTEYPVSRIEERFGAEVAHLVEGVTKIGRLKMMAPEARQAETVRKMLLAMVTDVRVVLVKLADRLHNMRTLEYLEPAKQQRIARETLDIYAPIALRLGMGVVRGELEDLAFRYLEPEAFFALQKEISEKAPIHKKFLEEVQATIQTKLVEAGIPAELESRVKGLYSVHRKIVRQETGLGQVYDLLAVRVITDSERNCYAALGVVHHIWRPVPGRFKDYIAIARPNLYQSLHTTVLHGGQPFEVQIRTQEMHRIAEEGVAAHWKYKSGKPGSEDDDQRITWMRQLIEWSTGSTSRNAKKPRKWASACSKTKRGISAAASRKFPKPTSSNSFPITAFPKSRISTPPSVSENILPARSSRAYLENRKNPLRPRPSMPSPLWSRPSNACWVLARRPWSSRATTTCSFTAPNVAIPFPATK